MDSQGPLTAPSGVAQGHPHLAALLEAGLGGQQRLASGSGTQQGVEGRRARTPPPCFTTKRQRTPRRGQRATKPPSDVQRAAKRLFRPQAAPAEAPFKALIQSQHESGHAIQRARSIQSSDKDSMSVLELDAVLSLVHMSSHHGSAPLEPPVLGEVAGSGAAKNDGDA